MTLSIRTAQPSRLFFVVTEACDSRCRLCSYWRIPQPRELDPTYLAEVLQPELSPMRPELVCLTGGEPTLHPELPRIVELLRPSASSLTLVTSTSKLEDHWQQVRYLIDGYLISLDGADAAEYQRARGVNLFESVIRWPSRIKTETDDKVQVAFSCVVQRANARSLDRIYDVAAESGVDRLFFRVPDTFPESFGRQGMGLPRCASAAATLDPADLDAVAASMEAILQRDRGRGLLGQSHGFLRGVHRRLAAASDVPHGSRLCIVPFESLVIAPSGALRPCFYLPHEAPLDPRHPLQAQPVLIHARKEMLQQSGAALTHCSRCNQFEERCVEPPHAPSAHQ